MDQHTQAFEDGDDAEATPLCVGCLLPVSPLDHYCGRCGACVGQFTPYLPFEFIPYYAQFFGELWNRLWRHGETPLLDRVFYAMAIIILEPLMLLALPFRVFVWRQESRRRRGLCLKCGYSLEGLDRPGRCPECNASVEVEI